MEFNTGYAPPPAEYFADASGYFGGPNPGPGPKPEEKIESKISIHEIGQTVTEGSRFGSLIKTSQDAIKIGASNVELQLQMGGGGEPVGAENYGFEARQALREISKANQINFTTVHAPTQIGNLSGFNPQQGNFSNQQRHDSIEEIKKAISFAADAAGGGGVVVHTGEYQRDMSDARWNRNTGKKATSIDESWDSLTGKQKRYANKEDFREFLSFPQEDAEQVHYLVDDRTGKIMQDVRKSMVVYEPKFKLADEATRRKYGIKDDRKLVYLHKDGGIVKDPTRVWFEGIPEYNPDNNRFETEKKNWEDFEMMAHEYNKYVGGPEKTAAEMFIHTRMNNQIMQSRGLAQYYDRIGYKKIESRLEKLKDYKKDIEKMGIETLDKEKQVNFIESIAPELSVWGRAEPGQYSQEIYNGKSPTSIVEDALKEWERQRDETFQMSSSHITTAEEAEENLKHIKPVEQYAKQQTLKSYAELGITAMEESNRPDVSKPIFVAPENIFPEMGYGSHPEEMIELVKNARGEMIKFLTAKEIEDPHGKINKETGKVITVPNPYYTGMSKKKAEDEANEHIKATLDTQHLGMWWKHFQPLPRETAEQRRERFNKWYLKMVDKMKEEDVLGHIHLVDSMGGGHHHLPTGQGNLPLVKAIEHLRSEGWKGTIVSEAHGEESLFGQGRILTKTWEAFGSPIKSTPYGISAPSPRWGDVSHFYGTQMQSPYFAFGSYVPSNDWRLWSEVPFE